MTELRIYLVRASGPDTAPAIGADTALYAVLAEDAEKAIAAVRAVVSSNNEVALTKRDLTPEMAHALELVPGEPKLLPS